MYFASFICRKSLVSVDSVQHVNPSLSLVNTVRATHMIFESLAVFQRTPTNLTVDRLIYPVLVSHVSPNVLFGIKVVTHTTLRLGCNKLTVNSECEVSMALYLYI